jgi:ketosteroid isomerase-like protein
MSQENVEIVRAAFDAYLRGETDAVLRLCDENIVITQAPEVPGVSPQQHGATRQRGRGKQSGVEVAMGFTLAFTVRGGKIAEWRIFVRQDQALEALGLRE